MLSNIKAYLFEGDEEVRRQLAVVLNHAGIGLAQQTDDADFGLLGAAPGILARTANLPMVALEGRADPGLYRTSESRLPFPFLEDELAQVLEMLPAVSKRARAPRFRELVGRTPAVERVREMMARVVDRDVTVMISGESGTGKEIVARCLHDHSHRKHAPFVPVNCGAIPSELLESELFGHEKGAFTGAISQRIGRFELADGGTLFLDEIGDLPLHMQVKLLRAIQERSFERVGGSETVRADVRIIAATHQNLEKMMARGEFRDDLYYRLNVFPIEMPALRERKNDIPMLIDALTVRLGEDDKGSVCFSTDAVHALMNYEWSGNVRELANVVERMSILHPNGVVRAQDLPRKFQQQHGAQPTPATAEDGAHGVAQLSGYNGAAQVNDGSLLLDPNIKPLLPVNGLDLREFMTRLERTLIQQALDDANDVVAHAADRLHIRRTTLVEKMRKYGLGRREANES